MKVVIVGGVAGGATAAARLRRLDETAEIIILERGGFISYANCGLPYYIGGVIEDKRELTLQTPQSFWKRFQIDVRVKNEVISIDTEKKIVKIRKLEDGTEYEESYDKLILSPGAKPVFPNYPGGDDERIFTLRTVEDTYKIKEYIEHHNVKQAVVVGGGFIGLEMAENLIHSHIETTLIQRSSQVMPPLDSDMASEIHAYMREKGICLRLKETIEGFQSDTDKGKIQTLLKGKEAIPADIVILAIGVVPEAHLAKEAGLELGMKDAIVVDEHMQTSAPDVYAVGDAVEVRHFVTGQKALIALAGPANKQGRIAADHICGLGSKFKGSQGSSVLKLFDMTIASTGINEKMAKAAEIPYDKVVTFSMSHAGYYPGASNMTIKTLFNPKDGRILGAQIVGFEGVDKRIDVIATAIRANMKAEDLEELDLAYAPPYSSAKDPVNMAGFVIGNIRMGRIKQYHWHDVKELPKDGSITLLDVRTKGEYAEGAIEGTINIPIDELRDHINELDKSKPVYVNCYSGLRSYIACCILNGNGFDCYNLSGGYRFYEQIMKEQKFDDTPRHSCGIPV